MEKTRTQQPRPQGQFQGLLSNPDYQARVLARLEEEKALREAEIAERDAAKEARPMSARKRRHLEDKMK